MFILTSEQFAQADQATIKNQHITSLELMERAAKFCADWIHDRLKNKPIKIHIFCGIGNNGGDGLVIARHLLLEKYDLQCYIVNFSDKRTPDFLKNYDRLKDSGHWPKVINKASNFPEIEEGDLVIDAIFGNGLSKPPKDFAAELIHYLNKSDSFILSIDIPSGLYTSKSSKGNAIIEPNHILSFQYPKLAFFQPENQDYIRSWELLPIGLDDLYIASLNPAYHIVIKEEVIRLYRHRTKWEHKGNFGHSLLIGGSFGKIGAISLASNAALSIGSGLVTAFIPKCGYNIIQTAIPEVMVEVDQENYISYFNYKTKPTCIGIGPGLGTHEKTIEGFKKFLKENELPLIIDADAINIISQNKELLEFLPQDSILTPHPKELERLIGPWENDFEKLEKAAEIAKKHQIILVMKGAHTCVLNGENFFFNSTGNAALATAGSGDALTGIITGLKAQNYGSLEAAILGVYLHGVTADLGSTDFGLASFNARHIIEYLPDAILELLRPPENPDENEA